MIDFLLYIWSRLVLIFQSVWNNVYWLFVNAFGYITEYVLNFASSVRDFRYNLSNPLRWYTYTVRPKSDFLDVFHFNEVKTVAVDLYNHAVDTFLNLRPRISNFLNGIYPAVNQAFTYGASQINALITAPVATTLYLLNQASAVVQRYSNLERPSFLSLLPFYPIIQNVLSGSKPLNLVTLATTLFPNLSNFVNNLYSFLVGLKDKAIEIFRLIAPTVFPKLLSVAETLFSPLTNLVALYAKIFQVTSPLIYERLMYALEKNFDKLQALIEQPQKSVLDMIYDSFMNWFFDRFARWLLDEDS